MMFGHDENQHTNHGDNPTPDGALDNNAPTALPPSDDAQQQTHALPNDDDAAGDYIMTDAPSAPAPTTDDHSGAQPASAPPANGQLLDIKQQALQQLSPLLGHLDQTPEEKFRTTMMMIQAADNDKLIPEAYEAAKAITDEKARAQALLDVVNEINYFTQQNEQ